MAESSIICSSRSRQPVRKLLVTPTYSISLYVETSFQQSTTCWCLYVL